MFSADYNPSANMGFGDRFKLNQAYSPTLAKSDLTPGMVQLMQQPMPTPAVLAQAPTMQQLGAPRGSLPPAAALQLAQLGGGLLNRAQPQAMMAPPQVAPMSGVSGNNGALQRLLGMYGIHGGLLGA